MPNVSATGNPLTAERLRALLLYDPATGLLTWRVRTNSRAPAGGVAGSIHGNGYVYVSVDCKRYLAHRLAWLYVNGVWPPHDTDHVNEVKNDNRLINLRLATRSENLQNVSGVRSDSQSGITGVSWDGWHKKWCANVNLDGKAVHRSKHKTLEEAIAARRAAEQKYFTFAPMRRKDHG